MAFGQSSSVQAYYLNKYTAMFNITEVITGTIALQ
jgi:hypothetical protein